MALSTYNLNNSTLLSELHVIAREDLGVIFHPETLAFFKVSTKTAKILKDLTAGVSQAECAERYGTPVDEVEKFLNVLQVEIDHQAKIHPPQLYSTELLGERLILLVSQDCNLRCRYCNAAGGDYGQGRGLMSPETAVQAVEAFIRNGKFLFKNVQFFGGEPTLNLKTVRAVCQYLTEGYQAGRISEMPWFTVITNGMLVSDEFIELVKEYNLIITFSIDGPQDLHDQYRVDLGGRGSYQHIVRNFKKLREATNGQQPAAIEATVTRQHLEAGYDHAKLQQFFMDELDVRRAHLVLIEGGYDEAGAVSEQDRTQWLTDMQASIIPNLLNGSSKASVLGLNLLKKLVFKRVSPYLCPVGVAVLTVNVDGSIYPCYQLMDSDFYMGKTTEKEVWKTAVYQQVEERMRANDKFRNAHCKDCWARKVCNGCLGELYAKTGSIEQRVDSICDGIRAGTEEVLVGLAQLRSTPGAWQQVMDGLKRELGQAGGLSDDVY
jgi:uncharacterized protein